MGKKLDALFCRRFKTNKFNSLLNKALTRLSILESQRQARCSQATSDVNELLKLGQHENAYHRVEQVIKEQNALDALFLIHGYFTLLLDRAQLLEHNRDCPQELLEAVSSLVFAASRIGEFPELQEIRNVLISHFGKDLEARSTRLHSGCGVNLEIIQKLSTRHPRREVKMKVLKEIAAENNIVLKLEEASTSTEGGSKAKLTSEDELEDEIGDGYKLSDTDRRGKKKFKDVADAAQAAFESATHAAEAARAALELSRFFPRGQDSPVNIGGGNSPTGSENKKLEQEQESNDDFSEGEGSSQVDVMSESKRWMTDSEEVTENVRVMSFIEDLKKLLKKDVAVYDSEEETKSTVKTNTTTIVKDEQNLINGSNRVDTDPSVEDPSVREVGLKHPVSVRTRRGRGY